MNKLKRRRLLEKIKNNKMKVTFFSLFMFIFLFATGYAALTMQLGINGTAAINYAKPVIEDENCPYSSGDITANYKENSGSNGIYDITLEIENNTNNQITDFDIYIYGPSDLDIEETAYFEDYTKDNGILILTPTSWCSTLYANGKVTYALRLSTSESNFKPERIAVKGCTVYGSSTTGGGGGGGSTTLKGITVSPSAVSIYEGSTYTLSLTTTPSGLSPSITWTSNNQSVATVSNGVVTGVSAGTATITASTGSFTSTSIITVLEEEEEVPELTGLTMSKTTASLEVNETLALSYTRVPSDATLEIISWTSSDNTVATVSANGLVTAVGVGTATITAAHDNIKATCIVTVTQTDINLTALSFNTNSATIDVGEMTTLILTKTPSNATNPITWSSSKTSVATVTNNGVVTGVGAGTATITASYGNISATCTITVEEPSSASDVLVTFGPGGWYGGTELQFKIVIENNTGKSISNVRLSVDLPTGTTIALWAGPEVSASGTVITWNNSISAGNSVTITGNASLPSGNNASDYTGAAITVVSYS